MLNVSLEQMQQYILTAQTCQQQRLAELEQRRLRGFEVAKRAAQILKTEFSASRVVAFGFSASRVVAFGSLLSENFHETSDLDLAVWGLPEKGYFKAVARLLSLSNFEVDLVEVQYAKPRDSGGDRSGHRTMSRYSVLVARLNKELAKI